MSMGSPDLRRRPVTAVPPVPDPARPARRREGGGEAPSLEVPDEPDDVRKLVVGHGGAHPIHDVQEGVHVLGREAVIAAALKKNAVAWPAGQGVSLVAHAPLTRL